MQQPLHPSAEISNMHQIQNNWTLLKSYVSKRAGLALRIPIENYGAAEEVSKSFLYTAILDDLCASMQASPG